MRTRREFILAAAAWPTLAWAGAALGQAKKPPVLIGWLHPGSHSTNRAGFTAFKEGMAALGYKEGASYVLEERWAEGQANRLPALAEELAAKKPAVIVTALHAALIAAAKAAPGVPVVQANGDSPVNTGLAKSLARPGGMVTGVTNISGEISEKYLELLLAAAPKLKRVGFLIDATGGNQTAKMDMAHRSAARYSVEARIAEMGKAEDIEPGMARLAKEGVQGLVITPPSGLFQLERQRIVKLALAQRWPVAVGPSTWVEAGALLSYGPDRQALFRRAAYYVDRILKGTNPGDLPIEQPTRFEVVVNMKTAKALGLTMPPSIMLQATRVIE